VFWAILTLGPLLVGASVSLEATLAPPRELLQYDTVSRAAAYLAQALPTLLSIVAFMLFYLLIPYRPIRFVNALIGGTIAGLLFSLLRYSFTLYVTVFPTYQTLYGTLALIPMTLLWTYLSWAVILAGAVVTAELPAWGVGEIGSGRARSPGARFVLALAILAHLHQGVQRGGGGPRLGEILKRLPARDRDVESMLNQLRDAGYVDITKRERWLPARDLHMTSLHDLYVDLRLSVDPDIALAGHEAQRWQERLNDILAVDLDRKQQLLSVTLADLFCSKPEEQKAESPPLALRRSP
jgi:membrane protein